MRSNLTPVYVLVLVGAFAVGLAGTLLTARSLLPQTLPAATRPLPGLQQPTGLPLLPASPAPLTTEC